jgi:ATP-dependent helicase Lhr and Lhr-like helicase
MAVTSKALACFHPLIVEWFQDHLGQPTDIQQKAWGRIARGEHLLITAPTGTGKTLAAFLWSLNQLITGQWRIGQTNIVYVSPLRALNNDIHRNLINPLNELRRIFRESGEDFPEIRVLTRSGDTPQSDRRQMLRHPPEILITTPESLNLMLSSKGGRSVLTSLSTVILDEIHSVYGTKRGVYLMTAVDRLVRLSGEFQRIALSATIHPLEKVAQFVGGFILTGEPNSPVYTPRPVSIVGSAIKKRYDLSVQFPRKREGESEFPSVWDPVVEELKKIIAKNRSTLIFVNSRRLCETLTLMINQSEEEPIAYAHHGSLSLAIRSEVERRLKAGTLRAIVATHSLELGIDIGALDEVVLVQSPFSISSSVQRVGRSGHQVNETSRAVLFPTHPKDLLESAVLAPAISNHDIEASQAVFSPLDVISQVIVSMVGVETWDMDELFANVKASHSYRNLDREVFDLVLRMLAGRYAESRIRELRPLISIDRLDNTVRARRGALQTLYLSGGVIPDRGYFHLRHQETRARIGELDEEFVWEAAVGDTFTLGSQNWQIREITHNDVLVRLASPKGTSTPFWKGEENGRDFHFSERIGQFLEEADGRLEEPDFVETLGQRNRMDSESALRLIEFLKSQRRATGSHLPHRHHLVVEFVSSGPGGTPQVVLHTMWGGKVNRPFALALDSAWQARFGYRLELFVSNDCIVLQIPSQITGEELLSLVDGGNIESHLRTRLEGSGFFGARFRECAARALLLPRRRFNERMPLWLSRLRSQKLLEAVLKYDDFPILLETWRSCLQDEFDIESLKRLLAELETGSLSWTEVRTASPSPFAQGDWWRQVNQYMYMDDTPRAERRSALRGSLLREVVLTAGLRPTISRDLVQRFELKRKRMAPGYSPQTARDLLDWVMERVAIPEGEWKELLDAIQRDHGVDPKSFEELEERLVRFQPPGARDGLIAARETSPRLIGALYGPGELIPVESISGVKLSGKENDTYEVSEEDRTSLLGQWLQFYGPVTIGFIHSVFGLSSDQLDLIVEDLVDSQRLIQGQLVTDGTSDVVCDSENFEALLGLSRIETVPVFEPLGIEWLPLFLADYQGISRPVEGVEGLYRCMEQLLFYPAEAETWEEEIFPARLRSYDPSWLDTLMQEARLLWIGSKGQHVTFSFESEFDLLEEESESGAAEVDHTGPERLELPLNLFPDPEARYDFSSLLRLSHKEGTELARRLWEEVWKGRVTNDTFIALRRGLMNRFKLPQTGEGRALQGRMSRLRRLSLAEKQESHFLPGNWHLVPRPELPNDLLETEERRKDRVRLLLDRYGILFRELLQREWPSFHWSNIFRALRIMELSGEVMSGIFFHGVPGPQFISHRAFRRLQKKMDEESVFWMNATDPASLCGIPLESVRGTLPARVASTHLVYRGNRLVMISKRNGKDLMFYVPADDPHLPEYMVALRHLLYRKFQPVKRISIETINGEKAVESPYVPALRTSFDVAVDYKNVTLYRKMW